MSILLALIPLKSLLPLIGLGGLAAFFSIKGKVQEVQAQTARAETAEKIVENHAVATQEAAAKTDGEADAALLADSQSDRK